MNTYIIKKPFLKTIPVNNNTIQIFFLRSLINCTSNILQPLNLSSQKNCKERNELST